jgi:hypothetical protein
MKSKIYLSRLLKTLANPSFSSLVLLLLTTQVVFSQTEQEQQRIANSYNQENLRSLELQFIKQANKDLQLAKKWADRNNVSMEIVHADGSIDQLKRVVDGKPLYYSVRNVGAAKTTRANTLNSGGLLNLNVNGENMTVGIWDGGAIRSSHQAFNGRATTADGTFSSCNGNNGHATHVAGTMVGGSAAGSAQGMAPVANVLSYDWNNDLSEATSAASNGLILSNHSYGFALLDQFGRMQMPVHIVGKYGQDAAAWDNLMYEAPYYQMVNAAGNDRQSQSAITNKSGYDLLSGHSISKNAIVVAAAYEVLNYTGANSVSMSSFSNYGPTDDGRIKPDITGKGVDVYSSYCNSNSSYSNLSGTSMASPNVTGTLLLIQQHYKNVEGNYMYAAMLRGLAIHTADEAGSAIGPDYRYGWGLLNAQAAAEVITNAGNTSHLASEVLTSGQSYSFDVTAGSSGPLEVTICWTDPNGNAITNSVVDPTTKALVNDLDLRASNGGTTYFPWKLNPASVSAAATKADNSVDNVEKIYIANPTPGATYTINVTHKNSLYSGSQRFALIVSGMTTVTGGGTGGGGTTYCASKGNSTADEWIASVQIDAFTNASNQAQSSAGYTDYFNQTINLTTGVVPVTLTPGFAGSAYNEYWKIWVDLNEDGDFDDVGELLYDPGAVTNAASSGNMTIPASAVGKTTRLRVSMKYNAAQTGPCEAFNYGEVEDYTIAITAPGGGGGYCASLGSSTADEWISSIQIGAYTNSSTQAQSTAGYTDYTSNPAINIPAGANNITLTPGFASSAYNEYWMIWMDFNSDGDFDDPGELVYDHGSVSNAVVSGVMSVSSAAVGVTTRMRISMKYNAAQTGPCETFGYGEVEDYSVNITSSTGGGNPTTAPTGYCASSGQDNNYEWIDLVEFGGVNNSTGKEAGGYGDYTSITGTLTVGGASQMLYVSAGFANTAYDEFWNVWIDMNRDGDFDDAGELVMTGNSTSDARLRASLTVPATASVGLTRMRVSMKFESAGTSCEVFQYGEVEDYLVDLVSGSGNLVVGGGNSKARYGGVELTSNPIKTSPAITVYPNPASNQISLDIERRRGAIEYSLRSIEGRLVKTGILSGEEKTILISELPTGTYLVIAKNGEHVWTSKFIKMR